MRSTVFGRRVHTPVNPEWAHKGPILGLLVCPAQGGGTSFEPRSAQRDDRRRRRPEGVTSEARNQPDRQTSAQSATFITPPPPGSQNTGLVSVFLMPTRHHPTSAISSCLGYQLRRLGS